MYYKSFPSPKCHPPPAHSGRLTKQANFRSTAVVRKQPNSPAATQQTDKPVMPPWFWPGGLIFKIVRRLSKLTAATSQMIELTGVSVFHRAIRDDLSNLPTSPRARLQRWIWFNTDSPTNTRRIVGIQGLFNVTLSYRKYVDTHVCWHLTLKKSTVGDFVRPKRSDCIAGLWIATTCTQNQGMDMTTTESS